MEDSLRPSTILRHASTCRAFDIGGLGGLMSKSPAVLFVGNTTHRRGKLIDIEENHSVLSNLRILDFPPVVGV
jgi:hypothetical protein